MRRHRPRTRGIRRRPRFGRPAPDALRAEVTDLYALGRRSITPQDDWASTVRDLPCVTATKCETRPTFARIHRLRELAPQLRLMSALGGGEPRGRSHPGRPARRLRDFSTQICVLVVRTCLDDEERRRRLVVMASPTPAGARVLS